MGHHFVLLSKLSSNPLRSIGVYEYSSVNPLVNLEYVGRFHKILPKDFL